MSRCRGGFPFGRGVSRIRKEVSILRHAPGNYVTDGLIGLLERDGVDAALPTYFIWEGNTTYLPMDALKQIIRDIRGSMTKFRLFLLNTTRKLIARGRLSDPFAIET